jgi:hypothetical protein
MDNEIRGWEFPLLMLIVLALGLAAWTARSVEERAAREATMSAAKVQRAHPVN